MKLPNITIFLNGKKYLWNWKMWVDLKTYLEPPLEIINQLNLELNKKDLNLSNFKLHELNKMASYFKENGNFILSRKIINYALKEYPQNAATLSVLCSLLRAQNKPSEAIGATKEFDLSNPALFTSRAAAFCDLKKWAKAKNEIARALAIIKDDKDKAEAFNVVLRIKKAKPGLYK